MIKPLARTATLLSLLTLLACNGRGNATATASATPGGAIPVQDLCPIFTRDLCVYLMQCGHAPYRDIDHCMGEVDCYGMNELLASAKQGSVMYDPSQVGQCHARFLADPCHFATFLFRPDIFEVLSHCPGAITPKLALGSSCMSSGECVGEAYCEHPNGKCPGVCTRLQQTGERCGIGLGPCAKGLYCRKDDTCGVEPKAGESCAPEADCGLHVLCGAGEPGCVPKYLWCDVATNTCKDAVGEGAVCGRMQPGKDAPLIPCQDGFFCEMPPLGVQGVCRRVGVAGTPCRFIGCGFDLRCSQQDPLAAVAGTCVERNGAGGACIWDADCQPGLRCSQRTCTAERAQLGEACSGSDQCAKPLVCESGHCRMARYPGDSCAEPGASCVLSRCKSGMCVHSAKVGAPCAQDAECTTNACVSGKCADTSVCGR